MKKILPIAAIGAGIYLAYRFLMQKKSALENLKLVPVSIAIDSSKSSATLFRQLFYTVKVRLNNNESQPVFVRGIDLDVFFRGQQVGKVYRDQDFIVPARSSQQVNLNTSINTFEIIDNIIDLVKKGFKNIEFTVSGTVSTDLGEIPVRFTKRITND
jgi:LEA14-like dessication related protein